MKKIDQKNKSTPNKPSSEVPGKASYTTAEDAVYDADVSDTTACAKKPNRHQRYEQTTDQPVCSVRAPIARHSAIKLFGKTGKCPRCVAIADMSPKISQLQGTIATMRQVQEPGSWARVDRSASWMTLALLSGAFTYSLPAIWYW